MEELPVVQRERHSALRQILRIEIDGDWDEEMIETTFDNLEKLLPGAGGNAARKKAGKRTKSSKVGRTRGKKRKKTQ